MHFSNLFFIFKQVCLHCRALLWQWRPYNLVLARVNPQMPSGLIDLLAFSSGQWKQHPTRVARRSLRRDLKYLSKHLLLSLLIEPALCKGIDQPGGCQLRAAGCQSPFPHFLCGRWEAEGELWHLPKSIEVVLLSQADLAPKLTGCSSNIPCGRLLFKSRQWFC